MTSLKNDHFRKLLVLCFVPMIPLGVCSAQPSAQPSVTAADYARAEKFMTYNVTPLVFGTVRPTWLNDDKFYFRDSTPDGSQFVVVDAASGKRSPLFEHSKLAATLSSASAGKYEARHLPFDQIEVSPDGQSLSFNLRGKRWKCDIEGTQCVAEGSREEPGEEPPLPPVPGAMAARTDMPSPNGKLTAFIRNWNLWVRDLSSGQETQLTTDGVKDFGYATDNAGWTHSNRPILVWSPDSKRIATFQQDQRTVGDMYIVETKVGHPVLHAWKYPLPGDDVVTMIQRVIIDVDGRRLTRLQMPPDQHRGTLCDDLVCRGNEWSDVQWSSDSANIAFISTSRDHKREQLRIGDARTGAVRDVMDETVPTYYESGAGRVNWRYLPASNEIVWFSERDNWGHLYLYDSRTGKLTNRITSGEWAVTQLLHIDEKRRMVYFLAVGREQGTDPYFAHLYRAGLDGKTLTLLTPEKANHEVSFSPSGKYFVDAYSTPQTPPITVLRDSDGKVISMTGKTDITRLLAAGWKPPESLTVKARDGQTDLYGLMYKPTNFDPGKKYPIINHIYPGPQGGSVGSRSFSAARGDAQALAELGFIVIELDGMGNPLRSKSFHDFYAKDLGDNTLPDQVSGMKQLAQRYSWIDLDRAGIYGHSGGGYAAADAMFRYPDFFKVGISESGNHDNREYEDDWAEKWMGLLRNDGSGESNYADQANQPLAKNLKGHLLLAHGTLDDNVPPYNTLLVANELIKANKDFDLLMLPNQRHGYGAAGDYMTRRRWDYFVRYLSGAEPPHEYRMHQGGTQAAQ
jgi:dipeptidyl aminopeptidase/acylaminoacyl peptidase